MQLRGRLGLRPRVNAAFERGAIRLRRRRYASGGGLIDVLPASMRERLGLDDRTAVGSRRIEIGPGPWPTPGYIHVDIDPMSPHLEALGPMWDLPFPDAWAVEIRGIQTLEHVHPSKLLDTLREWRRVLVPGGLAHVSVPNGPAIMRAFADAPVAEKWPLMGSILGMYCGPELRDPGAIWHAADHQLVLDFPMLEWAFQEAGFHHVLDVSAQEDDRHSHAWRSMVPDYCLAVDARA